MILLSTNHHQLDEVQGILSQLLQRGQNIKPLLQAIGQDEVTSAMEAFDHERSPTGQPWADLKHRQGAILQDTGALLASIGYQIYGGAVLEIHAERPYAAAHQYGTKHIPARPFFNEPSTILHHALDLIHEYFPQF